MGKLIDAAALKHKDWINIVKSFGCSEYLAEDICQEMYIMLIGYEQNGLDIWYNDEEINHWYIFKMLRGLYVAYLRRENKITKLDIDEFDLEIDDEDYIEFEQNFEKDLQAYEAAMEDIYWYDKKVFELITITNNISEISRRTDISYDSLRNTFIATKNKLKNKLL